MNKEKRQEIDEWQQTSVIYDQTEIQVTQLASQWQLSEEEIQDLLESRRHALQEHGRIEIGTGILPRLMEKFADSPYLDPNESESTLAELQELFYWAKTDSLDRISDEDLLQVMKDLFDGSAGGSLDRLYRSLDMLCREIRGAEDD